VDKFIESLTSTLNFFQGIDSGGDEVSDDFVPFV
jgi:hypothetical protein